MRNEPTNQTLTLLGQLVELTGGSGHTLPGRRFTTEHEEAALSEVVADALAQAREIANTQFSEFFRRREAARTPFAVDIAPGVTELLWHQFSYFIEAGLPPELVIDKKPGDLMEILFFRIREMYLRRDGSLMTGIISWLSPPMTSQLVLCLSTAFTVLYLHELARELYSDPEARASMVRWFAENGIEGIDEHDEEPFCAALATALLLRVFVTCFGVEKTCASMASAAIVWLNAVPLIGRRFALDEAGKETSFLSFLANGPTAAQDETAVRRLSAVLRMNTAVLPDAASRLGSGELRITTERALGSVGFVLPICGIDYEGQSLGGVPQKYKHLFAPLSDFVKKELQDSVRESLDLPVLRGRQKLHHYENPLFADVIKLALAEFLKDAAKAVPAVVNLEIVGSTVPLLDYNALVVTSKNPDWPDAIVMIAEGLCDILWHSFSLLVSQSIFVDNYEEFLERKGEAKQVDEAYLGRLQALLLSQRDSRRQLYERPSLTHSGDQKKLLAMHLNNAHSFVIGHEVAHILYANPASRQQMQVFFQQNGVAWPSGPAAEEATCDLFSALVLINSKNSPTLKAIAFISLLWATSLFSIPQWFEWESQSVDKKNTTFADFLKAQAGEKYPPGTRRFSAVAELVRPPILDQEKAGFVLSAGSTIFRALGVDPRILLQAENLAWPEEGTILSL